MALQTECGNSSGPAGYKHGTPDGAGLYWSGGYKHRTPSRVRELLQSLACA